MNACPSTCSSGPQNRIGIRLDPACASISSNPADFARVGSSTSEPGSSPSVTLTPCTSRSDRTTSTSRISGTSRSVDGVSPRSEATIAFVARFFAPFTSTCPRSGWPPRISRTSPLAGVFCASVPATSVIPVDPHFDTATSRARVSGRPLSSRNRKGPRPPRLSAGLELRDLVLMPEREPDIVEAFEEPPPSVIVDLERSRIVAKSHGARHEIDRDLDARVRADRGPEILEDLLGDDAGDQPCFPALPRKMSANRGDSTTWKP